jgi:hypothetical protein
MAITQVNKDKVTVSSTDQAGMKSTNEIPAAAFSRNDQGKLEVNKQQLAKLPGTITGQKPTVGQTPGSQQQQAPKAGEKIQLASVDAELDDIRKNAGL